MQISLPNIIEKIKKETNLDEIEIKSMIDEKMEELAGLISQEGAAHIIANELNIKLFVDEILKLKINDIKPHMRNISVDAKITNLFDLVKFEKESKPGKVRTCILGDETGRIRATFWHDATKPLESTKIGDILRVDKVFSKENNGNVEISISSPDQIVINPENVSVEVTNELIEPKVKKIAELQEDKYVSIIGTAVQIFKPTFFHICPECRKRTKNKDKKSFCEEHGDVEEELGYVLNAFIDDGTDVMRCVFFNNQVTDFINKDNDFMKQVIEKDSEIEKLRKELIGKMVKITGRIRHSSFSNKNELIVNKVNTKITAKDIEEM